MERVTIQMIAESAGVSRGTVDRVLHNRPNVKPEVREHVLKTARELGYLSVPKSDRALVKKIGVLFPGSGWFDTNLKQEWLRGVDDARRMIEPLGFTVTVIECETDLPNEFVDRITEWKEQGIGGIALCAKNSPMIQRLVAELTGGGIPVVTYNSDIPESGRACFIGQDPYQSGRVAADLVVKAMKGIDEVLVVAGNLEIDGHRQRVQGFCDKCRESGISSYRITIIESFNEYLLTYEKVKEALAKQPRLTAIYMANENIVACTEAVAASGRKDRIMIVGNDLTAETRRLLAEGRIDFIIKQDIYWQGYQPVILLKNLILSPESPVEPISFTEISVVNSENMG